MNVKEDLGCGPQAHGLTPEEAFTCVMGSPPVSLYDMITGFTVALMFILYIVWINSARNDLQKQKIEKDDFFNILLWPGAAIAFLVAIFVFMRP